MKRTSVVSCTTAIVKGHKNLVAFVTHGGINSIVETISIGKPMVVVPIFADQFRNGKMIQRYGTGLVVSKQEMLDEDRLFQALKEILSNNRSFLFHLKSIQFSR